jgi:hypothetical protein
MVPETDNGNRQIATTPLYSRLPTSRAEMMKNAGGSSVLTLHVQSISCNVDIFSMALVFLQPSNVVKLVIEDSLTWEEHFLQRNL